MDEREKLTAAVAGLGRHSSPMVRAIASAILASAEAVRAGDDDQHWRLLGQAEGVRWVLGQKGFSSKILYRIDVALWRLDLYRGEVLDQMSEQVAELFGDGGGE